MLVRHKTQLQCVAHTNGFSLTELSVSIMIIALLLAATLKGQSLVEEAKLRSIVSEVTSLQVATSSFYAKYTKYPGDFNEAVGHWGAGTADGNNNGRIEFVNTETSPVYEGYRLWQHLSLAEMVDNRYAGTATTSAAALITDVPPSKSGGGFMFDYSSSATAYDASTSGAYGMLGKNVMLLGVPLATSSSPVKSGGTLKPTQAMGIDAKMDDGVPTTGSVKGADGSGSGAGNCMAGSLYKVSLSGKDCILIFKAAN